MRRHGEVRPVDSLAGTGSVPALGRVQLRLRQRAGGIGALGVGGAQRRKGGQRSRFAGGDRAGHRNVVAVAVEGVVAGGELQAAVAAEVRRYILEQRLERVGDGGCELDELEAAQAHGVVKQIGHENLQQ